jgi:putative phosphoserine phosphatase / 1-acylglycerol-3-phosphate O-acyltransferase
MIEISHAQTLAEVDHDKPGPSVGAFFDLDGTLVSGFTAASFVQNRLREGELDTAMLGETLRLGLEGLRGRLPFDEFLALSLGTLAGRPAEELERLGHALFESEIRGRLQAPIVELVFAHRDRGHHVVLASSATSFQVMPVAEALGIDDVLCNRLEVDATGHLTGRLVGPVIWAAGKARAAQAFALANGIVLEESYFYADGSEDVASMYLVGHPRPVNPGRRMRAVAVRRGWPVIRIPESARGTGTRPRGSALPSRLVNALLRSGGPR